MPDSAAPPDDPTPAWSRAGALGLAAIIIASAIVRGAAMGNDLWLDEVWTLRNVAELTSAGGIFTQFLNDNNHPLASLWMYLVRGTTTDWLHRLPAWLAGIAAVWLAAEIARAQFRRMRPAPSGAESEAAALCTAALFASAYMLTVYFSEARGYGPVVACALGAFLALLRDPGSVTWRWPLIYWLACALGLLAHATMVHVMAGGLAWTAVRALGPETKGHVWREVARWHVVPITFAAIYYVAFLRHLSVGGGPETTLLAVLGDVVAYTLGSPAHLVVTVVAMVALAAGLAWLWPRSREMAALYLVTVLLAPVATIALSRFSLMFPRYLILSGTGALLLGGLFLGLLARRSRIGALAIVVLFIVAHSRPTFDLLRHGRGDFRAVLRHLAAQTLTPEISLCSDHDNRVVPLLQRYGPLTAPDRAFRYIRGDSPRRHGAHWLVVADVGDRVLGPEVRDDAGNIFTLEARFPHAPLSGSGWLVYRDRTFPAP